MLTLTTSDNRRKNLNPRLLRQLHDSIHHLINRLFLDRTSTLRTMWNTDPRIEQTKIVIDLRHGSNRGSRIAVRRFLIDGDCWWQSLDRFDIRFLHLS